MTRKKSGGQADCKIQLAQLLNLDLSREYRAIIAYVVYSQVLNSGEKINIADQLEQQGHRELQKAVAISRQIDYFGRMQRVTPKPVKVSENLREMLKFDLDNENETSVNYQQRIRQCEALGGNAMAEQIREITVQEQDHQIEFATALGEDVPDVSQFARRAQAVEREESGWIEGAAKPERTKEDTKCPHKPPGSPTPNIAT